MSHTQTAQMTKTKSPLSEAQILSGNHAVRTKTAGVGFGAGSQVSVDPATETVIVTNSTPEPEKVAALTADEIKEMINSAIAPVNQQLLDAKATIEVEAAQKQAAIDEMAQIKAALDASEAEKAQNAAQLEETTKQLEEAKKSADALADLGKLTGANMAAQPQRLEVLGTGSQEMRNWQKMIEQAPARIVSHNQMSFAQKDTRGADAYFKQNRTKIAEGVEAELREAGCLQGNIIATNAPTVMADIPAASFNYLANEMRGVTQSDLIYRQFARSHSVPGVAPRFEGQVPRYPYAPGPSTIADRELTPGTDISNQSQRVVEDLAPVRIKELGLGKDAANSAIALTSFVTAYSIQNLVDIVNTNLGVDYARTVDLYCRTIWAGANTTVYNNGGRAVDTPAQVVANGNGMCSRAFLRNLRTRMKSQRIPTYSNGCYAITLTPLQIEVLVAELAAQQRYIDPSQADFDMVTRIFGMNDAGFGGEVQGYKMTLDGFMVFEQNTHSIGVAGTEGVQSEALGAGAADTETCYAAGADSMCWATALPVEIRSDEIRDFGRRDRYIWYSHENAAALDVNEVLTGGRVTQERRVIKCNFTRRAV